MRNKISDFFRVPLKSRFRMRLQRYFSREQGDFGEKVELGAELEFLEMPSMKSPQRLMIFSLLWLTVFFLGSCGDADTSISAFLYTDNDQEEAFIERYNKLFPDALLNVEISRRENVFYGEIMTRYHSQNLPDIFSIWDSQKFHSVLESGDLADLSNFSNNIPNYIEENYSTIKMLPVRYNYGNVMLINMTLLKDLYFPLQLEEIITYEDLINLQEATRGLGYEFLVVGDPQISSLSDLFLSAVIGWIENSWLQNYEKGLVDFNSEQLHSTMSNFYDKLSEIFPNPDLVSLEREQAEEMFLTGKVLMIIGSTSQLLPLIKQGDSQWDLEWLSFPQTLRREKIMEPSSKESSFVWGKRPKEAPANYQGEHLRGAVQGDVLGIAVAKRAISYNPIRYNEISSVLRYYTGLYANGQRIRKWGIPVPSDNFIAADRQSSVMDKTIRFLNSINYVYYRPSLYLPEGLIKFVEQNTLGIIEKRKSVATFVNELSYLQQNQTPESQ